MKYSVSRNAPCKSILAQKRKKKKLMKLSTETVYLVNCSPRRRPDPGETSPAKSATGKFRPTTLPSPPPEAATRRPCRRPSAVSSCPSRRSPSLPRPLYSFVSTPSSSSSSSSPPPPLIPITTSPVQSLLDRLADLYLIFN